MSNLTKHSKDLDLFIGSEENTFYSSQIKPLIYNASDVIAPYWTLKTFIAVNPLQGFENLNFYSAVEKAASYFDLTPYPNRKDGYQFIKQEKIPSIKLKQVVKDLFPQFDYTFSDASGKIYNFTDLIQVAVETDLSKENLFFKKNNINDYLANFTDSLIDGQDVFKFSILSNEIKNESIVDKVKFNLVKWLQLYLDEDQAFLKAPNKKSRFFNFWKKIALFDTHIPMTGEIKKWIQSLPDKPSEAIPVFLQILDVHEGDWEEYFRLCFAELPGWTSYIKWKNLNEESINLNIRTSLLDYIAVWLCLEIIYLLHYFKSSKKRKVDLNTLSHYISEERDTYKWSKSKDTTAKISRFLYSVLALLDFDKSSLLALENDERTFNKLIKDFYLFEKYEGKIVLLSLEETFRDKTKDTILNNVSKVKEENANKKNYDAQLVFCIDVRSEQIRRSIESSGNYETFGFAGFFGLPVKLYYPDIGKSHDSCPVLLKPKHDICIHKEKSLYEKLNLFIDNISYKVKNNVSSFLYPELMGLFLIPLLIIKSLIPLLFLKFKQHSNLDSESSNNELDLNQQEVHFNDSEILISGISLEEQVFYSMNVLKMIGLTENFAPVVVFCGHSSTTENNPYASALDCGACGGGPGGDNANILAYILNDKKVRVELNKLKISIPDSTVFYGAEHNTTTDDIKIYKNKSIKSNQINLKQLEKDLMSAKKLNNISRIKTFNNVSLFEGEFIESNILQKSSDWSEVRPEWGLAGNAMFLIGPRSLSKNINFKGRSFLHSYDWEKDSDFSLLEVIMTAPMVVAQWINSQYYFSTVLNDIFGSGTKIVQNVVGKFGVMKGNLSDLKLGLPIQSLKRNDEEFVHLPLRLSVFIYAPTTSVQLIVEKHEILKRLVFNEWIRLIIIDPLLKKTFISNEKHFIEYNNGGSSYGY